MSVIFRWSGPAAPDATAPAIVEERMRHCKASRSEKMNDFRAGRDLMRSRGLDKNNSAGAVGNTAPAIFL
jgi:hypothetical protein